MKETVSVAIETSCRVGGLALGRGDELVGSLEFDASRGHAAVLVRQLEVMLSQARLQPGDLDELYLSAGPGSFTGVRVGVTVARTLGQMFPGLRLVAVPTVQAVAENARGLPWERLAVVLDARENLIYVCLFRREGEGIIQASEPGVVRPSEFLVSAPRPLTLIGEGLGYHDLHGEGITIADAALGLPTAAGAWRAGRRLAKQGLFVDYNHLLPIYSRKPEAVRLWEKRGLT